MVKLPAAIAIVVFLALFMAVGLVARNPFELALGLLLWMLAAGVALVVGLWALAKKGT